MKNKTIITALLLTAAVVGTGSFAFAQERGDDQGRGWGRPGPQNGIEMRGEKEGWQKFGSSTPPRRGERSERFASTTRMGRFGTSSRMMREDWKFNASSTRIAGKISNLTSNSFTISPMMRPSGTSSAPTFTINITASTTIRMGTTTGSISDLANDKLVMVFGSIDRSTNTITANEINVLPARPVGDFGTGTAPIRRGFFEKMRGGMSSAFQGFLNWFHK